MHTCNWLREAWPRLTLSHPHVAELVFPLVSSNLLAPYYSDCTKVPQISLISLEFPLKIIRRRDRIFFSYYTQTVNNDAKTSRSELWLLKNSEGVVLITSQSRISNSTCFCTLILDRTLLYQTQISWIYNTVIN